MNSMKSKLTLFLCLLLLTPVLHAQADTIFTNVKMAKDCRPFFLKKDEGAGEFLIQKKSHAPVNGTKCTLKVITRDIVSLHPESGVALTLNKYSYAGSAAPLVKTTLKTRVSDDRGNVAFRFKWIDTDLYFTVELEDSQGNELAPTYYIYPHL